MHRAAGLLVLSLLLLAPLATASQLSTLTVTFTSPTGYRADAEVTYTDEDAMSYRANADDDGDGDVSPEEASAMKARLQGTIEDVERSDHRLDGARPADIDVLDISSEGFIGAVQAEHDVTLSFAIDYTYHVARAGSHTWGILDANSSSTDVLHLHVNAPERWEIAEHEGFEGPSANATVTDHERGDRSRLDGAPANGFNITFRPRDAPPEPATDGGNASTRNTTTGPASDDPAGNGTPEENGTPPNDRSDDDRARSTPWSLLAVLVGLAAAGRLKPRNNS